MDGTDADPWSAMAEEYRRHWGPVAAPVWPPVLAASGVGAGRRVLDVGCGSGELLAHLHGAGLSVAGVDPAAGMVELARARVPSADVRVGRAEDLPWADGRFDLSIAVNALQLADDTLAGLGEMARVTAAGGHVAVANWAERSLNDLDAVERAIAAEAGDDPVPDGDLRLAGGLEQLLADGRLIPIDSGIVEVVWQASDDDALVRGVMLGEDPDVMDSYASIVIGAAQPFRRAGGGYRLVNHVRFAVGCVRPGTR